MKRWRHSSDSSEKRELRRRGPFGRVVCRRRFLVKDSIMDEVDNPGLPPGLHPDGLLGGIGLGPGSFAPVRVQAAEISSPVSNPADSSFRMPPLPPDALAGAFAPSEMTASQ